MEKRNATNQEEVLLFPFFRNWSLKRKNANMALLHLLIFRL